MVCQGQIARAARVAVDGFPQERWRRYEREKARGGCGVVMMFGLGWVRVANTFLASRGPRRSGLNSRGNGLVMDLGGAHPNHATALPRRGGCAVMGCARKP